MRRGFTLLELMIVIIILGVLATVGVMQYQSAIRKSRDAEARQILGQLRSQCAGIYMGNPTIGTANCTGGNLNINTAASCIAGMLPGGQCCNTSFFRYTVNGATGSALTLTATRCTLGGKDPQGTSEYYLRLITDFAAGTDTWSGALYSE